jgi:hypothetical protein
MANMISTVCLESLCHFTLVSFECYGLSISIIPATARGSAWYVLQRTVRLTGHEHRVRAQGMPGIHSSRMRVAFTDRYQGDVSPRVRAIHR